VPTEPSDADAPAIVGGRFDRGLRRVTREQTSLLSWLAESDQTEVLRGEPGIDLRDDVVVDLSDGSSEVRAGSAPER
jgi:hypothetical protein